MPPIGCCPSLRLLNETGGCFESVNGFAESFHLALDNLLSSTSSELQGMKYALGNAYEMTINVVRNPYAFSKEILQSFLTLSLFFQSINHVCMCTL